MLFLGNDSPGPGTLIKLDHDKKKVGGLGGECRGDKQVPPGEGSVIHKKVSPQLCVSVPFLLCQIEAYGVESPFLIAEFFFNP